MSNVEPDIDILDSNHSSNRPLDPNCDSVYLIPKSGRYTDGSIKLTEDDKFICVLSVGAKFLYIIPGFDVLGVELRHIQGSKIGNPESVFDMFIKMICRRVDCTLHMVLRDVTIIKVGTSSSIWTNCLV